jgi:formate dehydrogenase subunit gamma
MPHDIADELEEVSELLAHAPVGAEHLLPLLQQVQARVGYVSPGAIRLVAESFNLSRAEVHGVVTFYHDLRTEPVGRHVVQLCMAEACQAVGCRALARHAETSLGVTLGASTADGRLHVEAAYCFGNCALGPTIRIGDRVYGGVTPERFDALVNAL